MWKSLAGMAVGTAESTQHKLQAAVEKANLKWHESLNTPNLPPGTHFLQQGMTLKVPQTVTSTGVQVFECLRL